VGPAARAKGLELVPDVGEDVPALLHGDARRISQVLTNLLSNAVKFTEHGEVVLAVGATRQYGGDGKVEVRFAVCDTGIGIETDRLGQLFNPFVQADPSTTRKYGGTGLGLTISKQLAELMGGDISAESVAGRGSTFSFLVPLGEAKSHVGTSTRRELEGLQALVVDDNSTNRTILSHRLASWRMTCHSANSGPEAMELLESAAAAGRPYDIALVDFDMPGMDGIELARAIKASPRLRAVRLIMLSSAAAAHGVAEEAGFEKAFTKPVRHSLLFEAISTMVEPPSEPIAPRASSAAAAEPSKAATSASRVLIAEDNAVNQVVATRMLEKLGFQVDIACDGRQAVELAAATPYLAIFMDCQMPTLDGYEATGEIRRGAGKGRDVPIIAMTAHTMRGDREKCLAAGMDDYIGKPLRREALEEVVERALPAPSPTGAAAPTLG
jgi:CheY-like chemotaxis protein